MVRRLWEAAGLEAELVDDEDMEALRALKPAIDAGFPEEALLQLVRVFADAMHRVADAETRLFHFYVRGALEARGLSEGALADAVWNAGAEVSRLDEPTLRYFHRKALRHAIADTAALELAQQAGLVGLPETAGQRGGQVGHRPMDGKERPMPAQQQIFATDALGILPPALVVLMTILAMLGVIAQAATA
jgi:hypothetical protein